MSMPKGRKVSGGYATVKDGLDYRTISEIMTARGHKMNHATARNVLLSAMKTIATDIVSSQDIDINDVDIEQIAKSPLFQSGVADVIDDIDAMGKNDLV
jgi:hypothetical protein